MVNDPEVRLIVVGVDGTPAADHALGRAVDEAIIRGCPVHVVNAWDYEPLTDWAGTAGKTALMIPFEPARVALAPEADHAADHG